MMRKQFWFCEGCTQVAWYPISPTTGLQEGIDHFYEHHRKVSPGCYHEPKVVSLKHALVDAGIPAWAAILLEHDMLSIEESQS